MPRYFVAYLSIKAAYDHSAPQHDRLEWIPGMKINNEFVRMKFGLSHNSLFSISHIRWLLPIRCTLLNYRSRQQLITALLNMTVNQIHVTLRIATIEPIPLTLKQATKGLVFPHSCHPEEHHQWSNATLLASKRRRVSFVIPRCFVAYLSITAAYDHSAPQHDM